MSEEQSPAVIPYLGCKISLISKAEIRYEGTLYTIDTQEATVALAKVRSFGTEDRPTDRPVAPRNEVFEFIIFRGQDIKDLNVCEPPQPQPTQGVPLDPAIVRSSQPPPNSGSAAYSGTSPGQPPGLPYQPSAKSLHFEQKSDFSVLHQSSPGQPQKPTQVPQQSSQSQFQLPQEGQSQYQQPPIGQTKKPSQSQHQQPPHGQIRQLSQGQNQQPSQGQPQQPPQSQTKQPSLGQPQQSSQGQPHQPSQGHHHQQPPPGHTKQPSQGQPQQPSQGHHHQQPLPGHTKQPSQGQPQQPSQGHHHQQPPPGHTKQLLQDQPQQPVQGQFQQLSQGHHQQLPPGHSKQPSLGDFQQHSHSHHNRQPPPNQNLSQGQNVPPGLQSSAPPHSGKAASNHNVQVRSGTPENATYSYQQPPPSYHGHDVRRVGGHQQSSNVDSCGRDERVPPSSYSRERNSSRGHTKQLLQDQPQQPVQGQFQQLSQGHHQQLPPGHSKQPSLGHFQQHSHSHHNRQPPPNQNLSQGQNVPPGLQSSAPPYSGKAASNHNVQVRSGTPENATYSYQQPPPSYHGHDVRRVGGHQQSSNVDSCGRDERVPPSSYSRERNSSRVLVKGGPHRGGQWGAASGGYQSGRSAESLKFDTDFDFESANAQFAKDSIDKELKSLSLSDRAASGDGEDYVSEDEIDNGAGIEEGPVYYDKTKSFFDSISCEATDASKGFSWKEGRKLNSETFGARENIHRNHRGRGSWRGGTDHSGFGSGQYGGRGRTDGGWYNRGRGGFHRDDRGRYGGNAGVNHQGRRGLGYDDRKQKDSHSRVEVRS